MLEQAHQQIMANKYKIMKKLGAGSFGQIFLCQHIQKKKLYAVKIQKKDKGQGQLQYEIKLYQTFSDIQGVATMYDHGYEKNRYYMVIQLLGQTLDDLLQLHGKRFSMSTVLHIGIQIIHRIQDIHRKGYLHRDLKANNFMIGKNQKRQLIYIIDFGLAKRYLDPKTLTHISFQQGKSLVGTARYASVASHQGKQQGRKDDLQSLGFLLLYFAKGKLPWQGVQIKNKTQKYAQIGRIKKQTSIQKICEGLGKGQFGLVNYFNYVRTLKFTDEPDYEYARQILKKELLKTNQFQKKLDWLISNDISKPEDQQICTQNRVEEEVDQ